MSYYVGIPLLLFVALVEAAVLPMFRIAGLQPNLMLVLMVAWLMVRSANEAFVLIPIGGVILGLVDGAPMGTALLAMAPIAFLHDMRGAHLNESGFVITIAFVALMTVIYHLVFYFVLMLQGDAGPILPAMVRVVLPVCFLNVLVVLPTYVVLAGFSQQKRRPAYA
jgi:rod shape-determining protein MreD